MQTVIPFLGTIVAGEIRLHEHAAAVWLAPDKLADLDWAEADLPVLAAPGTWLSPAQSISLPSSS
jgi:8-oxo-dGTP diphosphatase